MDSESSDIEICQICTDPYDDDPDLFIGAEREQSRLPVLQQTTERVLAKDTQLFQSKSILAKMSTTTSQSSASVPAGTAASASETIYSNLSKAEFDAKILQVQTETREQVEKLIETLSEILKLPKCWKCLALLQNILRMPGLC